MPDLPPLRRPNQPGRVEMTRDFFNSDIRARILGDPKQAGTYMGVAKWLETPVKRDANLAFRNLGDLRFKSVGDAWPERCEYPERQCCGGYTWPRR